MAITWTVRISELAKGSGEYSVSAEVTDDTKPVGQQVENVSVLSAKLDTTERQTAVWDNLKLQYLAKVSEVDVTPTLEADAKTYLEK